MAVKLEYIAEYYSNNELDLDLFTPRLNMGKTLEYKFSCKVLMIFAQECFSDDLWLTLTFMAM